MLRFIDTGMMRHMSRVHQLFLQKSSDSAIKISPAIVVKNPSMFTEYPSEL
jgi:hypothetical protein